jgi:electron transport complex protein RnfD
MSKLLTVSLSPHLQTKNSIERLMYGVVIAMIPALIVSVVYYGIAALIVTALSVVSCLLIEFLIQKYLMRGKVRIADGSALVTGILLAFNLPANLPPHLIILGSLVAIGVGKMSFGGLGNNPFNPALVGRVFLLVSFPVHLTSTPEAKGFETSYLDASTGATPLGLLKEGLRGGQSVQEVMQELPSYQGMFFGNMGGALGEIAGFALILGLVYMLITKVIRWHIPIITLLTISVFTGVLWLIDPQSYADPLFHLVTGGVLLGAIFMATDYTTSPMLPKAMIIYSIGIGVLTVVIRIWGAYPEGISFAILIMNAFVPILDRYTKSRRFGKEVNHG